jgi:hypothetical protein
MLCTIPYIDGPAQPLVQYAVSPICQFPFANLFVCQFS